MKINLQSSKARGFTLLELLIVISIIAILSIALIFMLNPAETLKKSRDAQRISDLNTLKTAIGVMLTASSTPSLDNFGTLCLTTATGATNSGKGIAYSAYKASITFASTAGGSDTSIAFSGTGVPPTTQAVAGKVDGTGWVPINFKALTGGSPISSLPVDPINTIAATAATSTDLVYRYGCQNGTPTATTKPSYVFEIDAQLESSAYTSEDNKRANDGGDNASFYEVGNSLNVLPTAEGF